jgi:hypothetical protein
MTLDPKSRTGFKAGDANFLAKIDEHGWFVTMVAPRLGEEGDCFAYSTGLFYRFGQPEIIMFGLPLDTMHRIINIIGEQMKKGIIFTPDQDYADVLERYSCQFRFVDKSHYKEHLGWSSWFYEGQEYPTLQCFWPDKNSYYPWQDECSSGVRELQPFLFLPDLFDNTRVQ